MTAEELINHALPALRPTDTVGTALDWMEEFRVSQLPLVEERIYQGLISENILENTDSDVFMAEIQPDFEHIFANQHQHLLEILSLTQENGLDAIAVLDDNQAFLGTIAKQDLIDRFAQQLGSKETGAVLVLAVNERDYSMAEISRLIESNDTKIISSYFTSVSPEYNYKDVLTLKLNHRDITKVVATLERFGYTIEAAFANDPIASPDQERLDLLFRYLDI